MRKDTEMLTSPSPGLTPPFPPERTAERCQSEILRLCGDLMAEVGSLHPDPNAAMGIMQDMLQPMRRWMTSHHLIHAAERKVS